ncbi:MAG: hypothetical protein BWY45_03422 [Euryarchaeota archaeon ADurb.Bin294]|nr:MAG: hypothetical protein BWY45_03422 [Euryarchaeota archaeon ADurb.Bin294]
MAALAEEDCDLLELFIHMFAVHLLALLSHTVKRISHRAGFSSICSRKNSHTRILEPRPTPYNSLSISHILPGYTHQQDTKVLFNPNAQADTEL